MTLYLLCWEHYDYDFGWERDVFGVFITGELAELALKAAKKEHSPFGKFYIVKKTVNEVWQEGIFDRSLTTT